MFLENSLTNDNEKRTLTTELNIKIEDLDLEHGVVPVPQVS